ncbi:hypothetical protein JXO52_16940 [bacterium]|nr:hypothetical protein [bacterium]
MRRIPKLVSSTTRRLFATAIHAGVFFCFVLLLTGFDTACDHYPGNPAEPPVMEQRVIIEYLGTEYLPAVHEIDGLEADKANVLTFAVTVEHEEARALEVQGKVIIGGPPYQKEHAFTFRTDSLFMNLVDCQAEQTVIQWIDAGQQYVFSRTLLPPNEYYPFQGEQGKVDSIVLNTVYAIGSDGSRHSVVFEF